MQKTNYQVYQKPLSGNSIGIVFGTFAPLHQGHLDMIYRAKKENDGGVIVICCGNDTDDKGCQVGLPLTKRYQYVREFFKDDDLVSVYAIRDTGAVTYSFENWEPWLQKLNEIMKVAVESDSINEVWYVGEKLYCDDLKKLGKNVALLDRAENPISATMIRSNPLKYWNKIAHPFKRVFTHKVLVIGTASEGKSTLVQDLAKYFGTSYAHEWPRDYIAEHCLADWEFDANTFLSFLVGQRQHTLDQIDSPMNNGVFFCDTDALITAMYAQKYAQDEDCALDPEECSNAIMPAALQIASTTKWDKVFFLRPGNEFVDDHTRFMKHAEMDEREDLESWLKEAVEHVMPDVDIEYLQGGQYMENFEKVKKYALEVYNRANMD